jgi:hypothetical protein
MNDRELLEAAIKYEGTVSAVQKKTGYSKATVFLIRKNKYPTDTKPFYEKLKKEYGFLLDGKVKCPGLKGDIDIRECRKYREAARKGKILKGAAFAIIKDVCPFCHTGGKNEND